MQFTMVSHRSCSGSTVVDDFTPTLEVALADNLPHSIQDSSERLVACYLQLAQTVL